MTLRPLILISNDDGVRALGLRTLALAVSAVADVVVMAPLEEASAKSHALTLARPLRHRLDRVEGGVEFHSVDGTPADCVYVALFKADFLKRPPSLVLSGINHGYNLGSDTFYSGTVAAAREAALRGIPAIAFSLGQGGQFEQAASSAKLFVDRALANLKAMPLLTNVNFPPQPDHLGFRVCRLGRRSYKDDVYLREDPRGHEYFWIGGPPTAHHEPLEGTDTFAVDQGYCSVTPLGLDPTADGAMADLATLLR